MSERGKRHQSDTMPTLSGPGDCLTRKIGISSSIFHGGNLRERIGYSGDGGAESLPTRDSEIIQRSARAGSCRLA